MWAACCTMGGWGWILTTFTLSLYIGVVVDFPNLLRLVETDQGMYTSTCYTRQSERRLCVAPCLYLSGSCC